MSPSPRLLAAVAAGGAAGALARWGLTEAFPAETDAFPWATFAVNVVGSFLLALLPALAAVRRSRTLAVALGPGVLGGFTTFSSFSLEFALLVERGTIGLAALYVGVSLAAGFAGLFAGLTLMRAMA